MQFSTQIDSFINDAFHVNDLSIIFTQKNIESAIQKLIEQVSNLSYYVKASKVNVGNGRINQMKHQSKCQDSNCSIPREIFSMLGLKSRTNSFEDPSEKISQKMEKIIVLSPLTCAFLMLIYSSLR